VVTHRDETIPPPQPDLREINLVLPLTPPGASSDSGSGTPTLSHSPTPTESSYPPTPIDGDCFARTPYFPPRHDAVYTMATHVMHPPASLRGKVAPVLQTTNPVVPIDPAFVLGIARLERCVHHYHLNKIDEDWMVILIVIRALPLSTPGPTLANLHPPIPDGAHAPLVHLAGSYAYPGIPLLEGCVGSAVRAASEILASAYAARVPQSSARRAQRVAQLGGVDWDAGRGGLIGRLWRHRRGRAD
jgi:hypothetical protein